MPGRNALAVLIYSAVDWPFNGLKVFLEGALGRHAGRGAEHFTTGVFWGLY